MLVLEREGPFNASGRALFGHTHATLRQLACIAEGLHALSQLGDAEPDSVRVGAKRTTRDAWLALAVQHLDFDRDVVGVGGLKLAALWSTSTNDPELLVLTTRLLLVSNPATELVLLAILFHGLETVSFITPMAFLNSIGSNSFDLDLVSDVSFTEACLVVFNDFMDCAMNDDAVSIKETRELYSRFVAAQSIVDTTLLQTTSGLFSRISFTQMFKLFNEGMPGFKPNAEQGGCWTASLELSIKFFDFFHREQQAYAPILLDVQLNSNTGSVWFSAPDETQESLAFAVQSIATVAGHTHGTLHIQQDMDETAIMPRQLVLNDCKNCTVHIHPPTTSRHQLEYITVNNCAHMRLICGPLKQGMTVSGSCSNLHISVTACADLLVDIDNENSSNVQLCINTLRAVIFTDTHTPSNPPILAPSDIWYMNMQRDVHRAFPRNDFSRPTTLKLVDDSLLPLIFTCLREGNPRPAQQTHAWTQLHPREHALTRATHFEHPVHAGSPAPGVSEDGYLSLLRSHVYPPLPAPYWTWVQRSVAFVRCVNEAIASAAGEDSACAEEGEARLGAEGVTLMKERIQADFVAWMEERGTYPVLMREVPPSRE